MSRKFHKVDVVEVSPELAADWLGLNVDNYRKPRLARIRRYARDMAEGRWRDTGDPIRFDEDGYLVDGQNRLHAQVESGQTYFHVVVRGLTSEDVDALDQGASRTPAEVLARHGVSKYQSTVASTLRLLRTWDLGMIVHAGSATIAPTTQGGILELLEEYPEAENHQAWASRISKEMGFGPTVLVTARILLDRVAGEDQVKEFWDGVENFIPNGPKDPRRTLREWAAKRKRDRESGNRKSGSSGRVDNSEQLFAIFRAWNAWRAGEDLSSIRDMHAGKFLKISEPF